MSVLAFDDPLGSRLILSLWPSPPTKLQKLEPINATEIAFSSCFVRLLTKFGNADERLIHGGEKLGDLCQKGGEGVVCCQTNNSTTRVKQGIMACRGVAHPLFLKLSPFSSHSNNNNSNFIPPGDTNPIPSNPHTAPRCYIHP